MSSFVEWFRDEVVPKLADAQQVPGTHGARTFLVSGSLYEQVLERCPRQQTFWLTLEPDHETIQVLVLTFPGDKKSYFIGSKDKPLPVLDPLWDKT